MKFFNNSKIIIYYLGIFFIMIGVIILLPLVTLLFFPKEIDYAYCFVIPGVLAILSGYLISYFFKEEKHNNLQKHQDSILVTLIWISAILWSAIPFMLTKNYNFTQSVFEATSGYSTTGLSVVDVSVCPKIFLIFRSFMLFVGGIGLVLILTCAISDRYGLRLYNAEGHSDKLLPNLAKSARMIFTIYSVYIIFGIVSYTLCGMDLFDAINHSVASLSTGGFSTQKESIMHYNSVSINIITEILMLLGGTNFMLHLYLFRRQIKKIITHCEFKFMIGFLLIFLPLSTIILCQANYGSIAKCLDISFFQILSSMTTTGFQTIPTFETIPSSFKFILIISMLIGGGLGSTAGGIKQYRVVASLKGLVYNYRDKLLSNKTITTHYITRGGGREELTKKEISNNVDYILIYILVFILGSFIFTCYGYSVEDSMFEFASSLSTVGLSVGITGYSANSVILWTSIIGMFMGRLEIIVIFNALSKIKKDVTSKEWKNIRT